MKHVAAALMRTFDMTPAQADAIVDMNRDTLAMRVIAADIDVFGYIGADGSSDVMLVRADQVVCDLRIPSTHWA